MSFESRSMSMADRATSNGNKTLGHQSVAVAVLVEGQEKLEEADIFPGAVQEGESVRHIMNLPQV